MVRTEPLTPEEGYNQLLVLSECVKKTCDEMKQHFVYSPFDYLPSKIQRELADIRRALIKAAMASRSLVGKELCTECLRKELQRQIDEGTILGQSSVSSQWQTTLIREVRPLLGIKKGDRIQFVWKNAEVLLRKARNEHDKVS